MISVLAYLQTKIQFEAFRFCQAKLGVWRSLQTLCSDSGPKPAVELTPQPRDLGRLVCEISALTTFRHPAQKQTSSPNLRIAQYIRDSSCGDWKAYFPQTAWNQSDRMRKVGRLSLFNRPICHSDPVLGASASATNCIDKTPRRRRIRKAVARALSFTTYATPVTIDDGPAKQIKRDRELIIACDVARSIDSPPVLAAFEVLCHEKHCSHRSPQIQRRN